MAVISAALHYCQRVFSNPEIHEMGDDMHCAESRREWFDALKVLYFR